MKKKNQIIKQNSFTEFLLYTTPNGKVKVEIFLHNENIWLTQTKIAELFGVQRPAITKHLKNIFETKELDEKSVSSILEHTAIDGKKYQTKFYNLDAIISVGYRINSSQATQFRIWATERLKEYIIKGFTMNDEKLKDPYNIFGKDYFEIAKNYLNEKELDGLNRIVTMYLDYAEMQAQKGVVMYMKDWVEKLDAFLRFNEKEILNTSGKISHEVALALAEKEYKRFRIEQDRQFESDFDKLAKKLLKKANK